MIEGCFELIDYPEWWTPKGTKTQNNKIKPPPRAAAIVADDVQIPNMMKEDYTKLLKLLCSTLVNDNTRVTINMTVMTSNLVEPWILDFGANDHVTHHEDWLKNIKNNIGCTSVSIPNGKCVALNKIRSMHL